MEHHISQRTEIVKVYYQNACSVRQAFCALREVYIIVPLREQFDV